MAQLVELSAVQAIDLLKKGEVSPLELIEAAAERIEAVDGRVNALPTRCYDRAREAAGKIMAEDKSDKPDWYLHGLPLAVKDLEDVAGVRTTYGSPIFADHVPETTELAVRILEANGAVVMAKSNTPEFGAGANTFNEVFGETLNPWDTSKTCGGSSGGSAVALATGQAWLATGSDMGGSLRIPASFCSVVGFRPSPGRVPRGPQLNPFQNLSVTGPMARNVPDLALMLDAQTAFNLTDSWALPRPEVSFSQAVAEPRGPLKVAFSPDLGLGLPIDPEVVEICAQAARRFEDLGALVDEACPDVKDGLDIFQIQRAQAFLTGFGGLYDDPEKKKLLKPDVIWNIEKGIKLSGRDVSRAEVMRGALYHRVKDFFKEYDLLLCPTVLTPPFDVKKQYLAELNGVPFDNYVVWLAMTFVITVTTCPAISIPGGFTAAGLPVGLQIVGPQRGDAQVLAAAALLERDTGSDRKVPLDPKPPVG